LSAKEYNVHLGYIYSWNIVWFMFCLIGKIVLKSPLNLKRLMQLCLSQSL